MAVRANLQVKARRVGTLVYHKVLDDVGDFDYAANVAYRAKKTGEILGTTSGRTERGSGPFEFLQIVVAIPDNPLSPLTSNFDYFYFWVDSSDVDLVVIPTKQTSGGNEDAETVVLTGDGSVPGNTEIVVYKNTEGISSGETITIRAERATVAPKSLPGWLKWAAFALIGLGMLGVVVVAVTGRNRQDDDTTPQRMPRRK